MPEKAQDWWTNREKVKFYERKLKAAQKELSDRRLRGTMPRSVERACELSIEELERKVEHYRGLG